MDLDSLEVDTIGSNEDLSDAVARSARSRNLAEVLSLETESDEIKDKLAEVKNVSVALFIVLILFVPQITKVNTTLLQRISGLLEEKSKIVHDLKAPGIEVLQDNVALLMEEEEDAQRKLRQVSSQSRAIQAMKTEILDLKRKEPPRVLPDFAASSQGGSGKGALLPPVQNGRRKST